MTEVHEPGTQTPSKVQKSNEGTKKRGVMNSQLFDAVRIVDEDLANPEDGLGVNKRLKLGDRGLSNTFADRALWRRESSQWVELATF